jgi:hypothetical protein
LRQRKVEFIILEKQRQIGSSWHRHYERLQLHTIKSLSSLPFPALTRPRPRPAGMRRRRSSQTRFPILWGVWAIVFAAFFLVGALGYKRIERATGWFVVVAGFATCILPGATLVTGTWNQIPIWLLAIIEAAPVVFYLWFAGRSPELGSNLREREEPMSSPTAARARPDFVHSR